MAHTAPQGSLTILHTALQYTAHCTTIYSTLYYTALVTLLTSLLHTVHCSGYTAQATLNTALVPVPTVQSAVAASKVQHSS